VVVPKQIIIISVRRTRAASTVTWRASTALRTSRRRFLAFQKPRQTTVANCCRQISPCLYLPVHQTLVGGTHLSLKAARQQNWELMARQVVRTQRDTRPQRVWSMTLVITILLPR
jgi:hypothetical protein